MNAKLSVLTTAVLSVFFPALADDTATPKTSNKVEVITVSGDFKQQNLQQSTGSIAVVTEEMIRQRNAQHLEDVLNTSANVNFSAGTSRARHFQVRGIGERSQFVDSVNPSVGVTIDGIDYSGIGTAAGLFDIEQVEIFRGPQGTRFGANAMAGMINLKGLEADGQQSGKAQISIGNYNSQQIALAHGTAITDNLFYRVAVQKLVADGYIKNIHLNRDDTNGIDEFGTRLNVRWLASEDFQVDFTGHYFDIDNGYDTFSLDNNRQTRSDQPGFDKQKTKALGVVTNYTGFVSGDISLQLSVNNSDLAYGYDEDWTHTDFHPYEYSSFDHYFRDHENTTMDLRVTAKPGSTANWVAGFYRQNKQVNLNRLATYGFTPVFNSTFSAHNAAIYGQRDWQLDEQLTLTAGLRAEIHDATYQDSVGTSQSPSDTMWGGKINIRHQLTDNTMIYTELSRGYKAGGVNGEAIGKALVDGQDTTAAFLVKRTTFAPEVLHNLEFGVKGVSDEGDLTVRLSAFYTNRDDIQLKGYATESASADTPAVFTGYIENGSSGSNYGIEVETNYQVNAELSLFANLGLLRTEIEDFIAQDGTNMNGRDQAHAPQYQYNVGVLYDINQNWFVRASAEGKDEFYYSMSHNVQSNSVNLVNVAFGYQAEDWDVTVWGRNVFDEDYGVRGFFFGNDPRIDYTETTYTQLGEPAQFGATARYNF